MKIKRLAILFFLTLIIGVVACDGAEPGDGTTGDPAARAVEEYLSAKVRGNDEGIRAGLCSAMEADLERELRTFESVSNAAIENMSCTSDDPVAENETAVRCSGEIVALYGTEETKFPLGAYLAVSEDGEWKWCGETQ